MAIEPKRPGAGAPEASEEEGVLRDTACAVCTSELRDATEAEVDQVWSDLLDGRWQFLDYLERGAVRYLVLGEGSRNHVTLSPVERLVTAMVARGAHNKEVAYSLEMSPSTVATLLRRASCKLTSLSRPRLCMIYALLFDGSRPTASRVRPLRVGELVRRGCRLKVIATSERVRAVELTPGEREVAMLVASGLSNLDVALRRRRSVRTIANQLASVFRKLSVSSRAELAAALVSRADGETGGPS
jgi:DNA-binding CsgD family transcriptional regulator